MSRCGDGLSAAFWGALGATILVASWRMDRLAHLDIALGSVPGLLPGVVGALMIAFALLLALQSWRATGPAAESAHHASPALTRAGWSRSVLATLLCLLFAGISLGHGWPFQLEAAIFIAAFTACFRWHEWRAQGRLARGIGQTVLIAGVAAAGIGWLFESVFLVRLP